MPAGWRTLHYGWVILGLATMVVGGAIGLARFGYGTVLPAMQQSLGLDNTQAGLLATANLSGYLVLALLGGALASRLGPRAVITAGMVLVGGAMLLTGLAPNLAQAAFWRLVAGLGSGASNVPVMGLLASWFATRRRGLASGIAVSGSSVVLIVLGPGVPAVLQAYPENGWRLCWLAFGALCLLIALLAGLGLRNHPYRQGLKPLGAAPGELLKPPATTAVSLHTVYRTPEVWHLGMVYAIHGFSYIIYITFFIKALVGEGGYSPPEAGRLFMVLGWCSLLCGLIWGHVSDVIGRKQALFLVFCLHIVAFGLFGLWPNPVGFTISAIIYGLTAWSIAAIMAASCGDLLGSRLAPAALGFITFFFGIGQALGPLAAGLLADVHHSLYPAMTLAAGMALLGALLSLTLRPVVRLNTTPPAEAQSSPPPP